MRFAASKLAEGDSDVLEKLKLDKNEQDTLTHIIKQMEEERGLDHAAAIADMRFRFIESVCRETVVKPKESREHTRSEMCIRDSHPSSFTLQTPEAMPPLLLSAP